MAPRPKPRATASPFEQLDYLYTPSQDVAADARYFSEVLGGRVAFAVEGMGARVAKVELTDGPPHILLTDHLKGDRPVFIYRVADLGMSLHELPLRVVERIVLVEDGAWDPELADVVQEPGPGKDSLLRRRHAQLPSDPDA